MPSYDDYSNTYLTHDSAAGRKQQRRGWKFRENFKLYYEKYLDEWRSSEMGLAAAQQAYAKTPGVMLPPLPEGWIEEDDQVTRTKYYIHVESGKRQWLRPGFSLQTSGPNMPMMPPPMNAPNVMMQPPPFADNINTRPPPSGVTHLPPPPMPPMIPPGGFLPPPPMPMGLPLPPPFPPASFPQPPRTG